MNEQQISWIDIQTKNEKWKEKTLEWWVSKIYKEEKKVVNFNVTLFGPWNQLALSKASGGVYSKVCSDLKSIKVKGVSKPDDIGQQ